MTWRVRYVDPEGRPRSKSYRLKALADEFSDSVSHHLRAGDYVDPKAGQIRLRDYLEKWRGEQAHHRESTAESTKTRFSKMIYPHIGDMQLGRLKPSTFRQWQKTLLTVGYSPSTINGCRGQLAGALNDAIEDRLLASNPLAGVKTLEEHRKEVQPPTVEQVHAAAAKLAAAWRTLRYAAVIWLVAGSGLRPGEVFGLTWNRVDLIKGTIKVDRQLVKIRQGIPFFGPPKTKKSNRTVPISDGLVAELKKHRERFPGGPDDLVFRTVRGTPISRGVFGRQWAKVRDLMGLDEEEGLHQLRHFYASMLIAQGRSIKEIQERMGHASAQETWDTYGHLFPDSDQGTRDAVDGFLFGRRLAIAAPGLASFGHPNTPSDAQQRSTPRETNPLRRKA